MTDIHCSRRVVSHLSSNETEEINKTNMGENCCKNEEKCFFLTMANKYNLLCF